MHLIHISIWEVVVHIGKFVQASAGVFTDDQLGFGTSFSYDC